VIAATITIVALTALVVFVAGHNTNSPTYTNLTTSPQANRDAETITAEDQAPHTARLSPQATAAAGLRNAVRGFIAGEIARGAISGPLQLAQCRSTGSPKSSRQAFSCSVMAASVIYRFLGTVQPRLHQITYCKHDPPPAPSDVVPVSRRCSG
jgi:hypothetical protein